MNTQVYSFIFNVTGIRGDNRLDIFEEIDDDTEISITIDGFEHKILIETDNGVFGSLSKNDVEKCFQAIAEISGNDIHNVFHWTVNYDCELVSIDKINNKCKIKIEFWHEDFDRDSLDVDNSKNNKLLEETFNWDLWHSLYNKCSKLDFTLAGVFFTNEDGTDRMTIINDLSSYFPINLVEEPTNPFDKNAIAVYSIKGKIGYVPKDSINDVKNILPKIKCMRGKKNQHYVIIEVLY